LILAGITVCLGLSPGIYPIEPVKKTKPDPAKELAAIEKDWLNAQQAFFQAYQKAKTGDERKQILKTRPDPVAFADRYLKLAEAHPDSQAALQALARVVSNAGGTPAATKALPMLKEKMAGLTDLDLLHKTLTGLPGYGLGEIAPLVAQRVKKNLDHPQAAPLLLWISSATQYGGSNELNKLYNETIDLLMERFVDRQELAPIAVMLARDDDPAWAEKHLRRLLEENRSEIVKAEATFALAAVVKNKDEASQPEATKLFHSVIENKSPAYKNLQEQAKKELDDQKLRGIGKHFPEISGLDLDGKQFKLSDYKGKVVLIDFWGFW
jgi:hypothetical protein